MKKESDSYCQMCTKTALHTDPSDPHHSVLRLNILEEALREHEGRTRGAQDTF